MSSTPRLHRARAIVALAVAVLGLHLWLLGQWTAPPRYGGAGGRAAQAMPRQAQALSVRLTRPQSNETVAPQGAREPPRLETARAAPARPLPAVVRPVDGAAADTATSPPSGTPPMQPVRAGSDEAEGADGGDAALAPPPVYATRIPAPTRLQYQLQWGARSGDGLLHWQHDGRRYELRLDAQALGAPLLSMTSRGGFDPAGLAPEQFVDRRRGRGARAAAFDREGGRIVSSRHGADHPAWPGAQDRLAWVAQLAAIAAAAGEVPPEVSIFVVDARGYGAVWSLANRGRQTIDSPLGPVETVWLQREPQRLDDWRVEAWLDPQRGHWPAKLRMTVARSGAVFEMRLAAALSPP